MKNLVIALFIAMAGCSTQYPVRVQDASRYAAPGTKVAGRATVYVLRGPSRAGGVWSFPITLDGQRIGSIYREQYIMFTTMSGYRVIGIDCPSLCMVPSLALHMDLTADNTYYFMVDPAYEPGLFTAVLTMIAKPIDAAFAQHLMATYVGVAAER